MKVVFAGCRDYTPTDDQLDKALIELTWGLFRSGTGLTRCSTEIIHGGCKTGVDAAVHGWAQRRGLKVKVFPADWDRNGRAAGPIRNKEMAVYGEYLICWWDGMSRGTESMISEMVKAGKNVTIKSVRS